MTQVPERQSERVASAEVITDCTTAQVKKPVNEAAGMKLNHWWEAAGGRDDDVVTLSCWRCTRT